MQWRRLRQDLERTRLLVELIRKREKLKRDLVRWIVCLSTCSCFILKIKVDQQVLDNQIRPLHVFLHHVLEQLEHIDNNHYFANPVDEADVGNEFQQ